VGPSIDLLELARIELDRVVGHAVARPAEVADQRQVDLAADHPQHAVELAGRQPEPAAQQLEGRARQELLGLLDPAERGDPVDPVDRADLVDVEAVDVVVAQQGLVARAELGERLAERRPELVGVGPLHVLDLGIVGGDRVLCDQLLVVDQDLSPALAQLVEAGPHRDRAHPAPEVAAAGVLGDLARSGRLARRAAADEQALADQLLDVVQPGRPDPHPGERDVDLTHVVAVERGDRPPDLAGTGARQVEIGRAQPVERGVGELGGGLAGDELDHVPGVEREPGPRGATLGDDRPQPAVEVGDALQRGSHGGGRGIEERAHQARRGHRHD
jgi:hypothetical protein